jgi:hypothetical protein
VSDGEAVTSTAQPADAHSMFVGEAYRSFVKDLGVGAEALQRVERQQPLKGAPEGRK